MSDDAKSLHDAVGAELAKIERVFAILFDHYLSAYEQNDGEANAGIRDALGMEAEELVPHWRPRRDEWKPRHFPEAEVK